MDATKQKTLTTRARVVLSILGFWCKKGTTCKSTYKLIAGNTGLSKHQVYRGVADLKEAGFLIVRPAGLGDLSTYILTGESITFLKNFRSEVHTSESAHVHTSESAHVLTAESAHVLTAESAHVQITIKETNTEQSSSSAPAVFASLQKLEIQTTPAVVESVVRNPEDAACVLTWLAVRLADTKNPIRNAQAFATAALRDPAKFAFTRDSGGKLVPPETESRNVDRGELARQRSAKIDADMERRRLEDAQAARQREADVVYQTNLAAWWLGLSEAHKGIVVAKAGGSSSLSLKDQTYKFWLAAKCYRDGLLPGAVPPPQKPKVGEP